MKLEQFIDELKEISKSVDSLDSVEVQMADCTPVVGPILKDNVVFITDIEESIEK